jgi:NTP pyrophosphatase (non-canonical NTP hydrolase)
MRDLQNRVRGWSVITFGVESTGALLAKLDEEVGELREAVEAYDGHEPGACRAEMRDECADVLIVLAKIANAYGVDLTSAAEVKMDVNERRTWERAGNGVHRHVE